MRLVFVHHVLEDRGSAQDMFHYVRAANACGHEIALYGAGRHSGAFDYSIELRRADAVIFIFEWTQALQEGDVLDLLRLVGHVPRHRRVVIDCDGKYNDAISVVGDVNHRDDEASRRWVGICDSLSDKILQPTPRPLRANVQPFLFHGYSRDWELPLAFNDSKPYGMVYVGNNWFRWRSLRRLLETIEPIREQVGRIGLVGNGWRSPPPWANDTLIRDAYESNPELLKRLRVETVPPVAFDEVVPWMSRGVVSPVLLRPLFDHLGLVTCRTFETPAASTIPLFVQDAAYVRQVYGADAVELVVPADRPQEKLVDVLRRPERYAEVVRGIREHLRAHHSYEARLRHLLEIVES